MLTDQQLLNWLNVLARTRKRQRMIVEDLLKFADEDGMSDEDRADCQRATQLLDKEEIKYASSPPL